MVETIETILRVDGLEYKLTPPKNEPDEFEPRVIKFIPDIFGKDSIYLNRFKLESLSGRVRIPDGFVITFNNKKPQLYIIEYEISKKLDKDYVHTLGQLSTFKNSLKNPKTKMDLIDKFTNEIKKDKIKTDIALKNCGEIAQLTQDIVRQDNPDVVVIIDSLDPLTKEVFDELHPHPHYIEFKTFKNGEKEAYLFERMYEPEDKSEIKQPIDINEVEEPIIKQRNEVQTTIAGIKVTISRMQIESATENSKIKTFEYRDWYVEHKGERYPIKGLIHLATGIPINKFNVTQVRPLLEQLGFKVKKVER